MFCRGLAVLTEKPTLLEQECFRPQQLPALYTAD